VNAILGYIFMGIAVVINVAVLVGLYILGRLWWEDRKVEQDHKRRYYNGEDL